MLKMDLPVTIENDEAKLKSIIKAYPCVLFRDDLALKLSDAMFDWLVTDMPHLSSILEPYVEKRKGNKVFNSYVFGYKLEYTSVNEAIDYFKQFNETHDFEDFVEDGEELKNSAEYIRASKLLPDDEPFCPLSDEFVRALVENFYSEQKLVKYLFEQNMLIKQHDIVFSKPSGLVPERALKSNLSVDEMKFLEGRGYRTFVPSSCVFTEEAMQIAERTGYHEGFTKLLTQRMKDYGMTLPKYTAMVEKRNEEIRKVSKFAQRPSMSSAKLRSLSPTRFKSPTRTRSASNRSRRSNDS